MSNLQEDTELREQIGDIVHKVHTDGRLQGTKAQDAGSWKKEVLDSIGQIMQLIHSRDEQRDKEREYTALQSVDPEAWFEYDDGSRISVSGRMKQLKPSEGKDNKG